MTDLSNLTPKGNPSRSAFPPFNAETAAQKVRVAEDGWNSREPIKVAQAYAPQCTWRNRTEFIQGRSEIEAFLTSKWEKENEYRLIKELWAFTSNRIAVRFAYEWHDDDGSWFRSYGNENWEFDADGLMQRRIASINDLAIEKPERKFHWTLDIGPSSKRSPQPFRIGTLGQVKSLI